ncbi:hypothetical protein V8C86DRAFT_2497687 [Haematococcus lacustris]
MGLSFNLLDQLTFYGSYHHNRWNQLIHFFFVPTIFFTFQVWATYSGPLVSSWPVPAWLPPSLQQLAQPNVALLLSTLYSLFYISLEPVAGLSFAACLAFPGFFLAGAWVHAVPKAWAWAIPIHVFSWVMQIWPGHIILEKARPALVDNLVQAFALAPFFVWFELLFFLGYRPDLYQQLEVRVQAAIEERNKHKKPLVSSE